MLSLAWMLETIHKEIQEPKIRDKSASKMRVTYLEIFDFGFEIGKEKVSWDVMNAWLQQRFEKLSTWRLLFDNDRWTKQLPIDSIGPEAVSFRIEDVLVLVL